MRTGTGPETTSWRSLINSTALQSRFTDEGIKPSLERPKRTSPFAKVEEGQRVGFETVLRLMRSPATQATDYASNGR